MNVRHKIAGTYVNPVNPQNIFLEINHDQESVINQPRPHVGISNLELRREDVAVIMAALNQAPGITEGIPYDIEITERGVTEIINMYVDCMDGGFARSDDGINTGIKMVQSLDNINDRVDGFTCESMYNETGVQSFVIDNVAYTSYQDFFDKKCIYVPYVISSIPNYQDAFMALFGITYIANELYKTFKMILQWVTPTPGIGVTISVGQVVIEIAYAILLIVTLIALLTQLINCLIQPVKYHGAMLMKDLLDITAVKLGLTAQSSIWSVYPYNQIAYLPEKFNPVEGPASSFNILGSIIGGFGNKGYIAPAYATSSAHDSQTANIQHGYFNGTGGDFLRLIKSFCNGKIIIPDQTNILQLERRDYYPAGSYLMPKIRMDWNGYNTEELMANMRLQFINDPNEKNCANNNYSGTVLQVTHQQISITNQLLVSLKGLREIQIAAARGVAKKNLTFIEKAVKDLEVIWHAIENVFIGAIDLAILVANGIIVFLNILIGIWNIIIDVLHFITDVLNTIIDAVNTLPGVNISHITVFDNNQGQLSYVGYISPISFVSLSNSDFSNRINALLLENDIVDTPKLLLVDTSRSEFINERKAYLHNDNSTIINALNLWNKFYYIDAFVGTPNNRFTKISPALNSESEKNLCTVSLSQFKSLVSNPQFLDNFGEPAIADSIQWYPERNGAADFSFRKAGWKADPQNPIGIKRAAEIAINLELKITVPNGQ